jgi:hypothetical protein
LTGANLLVRICGVWPLAGMPREPAAAHGFPDFSGFWGGNAFNREAPPSGQGPIANMWRLRKNANRPSCDGEPVPLVGADKRPILIDGGTRWIRQERHEQTAARQSVEAARRCKPMTVRDCGSMSRSRMLLCSPPPGRAVSASLCAAPAKERGWAENNTNGLAFGGGEPVTLGR